MIKGYLGLSVQYGAGPYPGLLRFTTRQCEPGNFFMVSSRTEGQGKIRLSMTCLGKEKFSFGDLLWPAIL